MKSPLLLRQVCGSDDMFQRPNTRAVCITSLLSLTAALIGGEGSGGHYGEMQGQGMASIDCDFEIYLQCFESPIQGLGEKGGPVISVAGFLEVQNRTRMRENCWGGSGLHRAISGDLRWDGWEVCRRRAGWGRRQDD